MGERRLGSSRQDSELGRTPRLDEIDAFGITHAGLARPSNQDNYLLATLGRELHILQTSLPLPPPGLSVIAALPPTERVGLLAVVADGVGGNAHGEKASRIAVEEVTSRVARILHRHAVEPLHDDAIREALREAARQSHAEILRRAGADAGCAGMATTLTLWIGTWPRAFLLQIGDSRYYLLRGGQLTQGSRDQTVAQDLADRGVLVPSVAARTRWAHVLSSALGGTHNAPAVSAMPNDRGTVHLLCSDGLTRHVADERIRERLLTMTSARQVCTDLLQDALDAGGLDNITIVVGRALSRGDR